MAVLDGIKMDVVKMPRVVVLVSDDVFDESALPDAALALGSPTFRVGRGVDAASKAGREAAFDQSPPCGIVIIAARQRPHHVQMLRQDHRCIDMKRSIRPHRRDRPAEQIDMLHE